MADHKPPQKKKPRRGYEERLMRSLDQREYLMETREAVARMNLRPTRVW